MGFCVDVITLCRGARTRDGESVTQPEVHLQGTDGLAAPEIRGIAHHALGDNVWTPRTEQGRGYQAFTWRLAPIIPRRPSICCQCDMLSVWLSFTALETVWPGNPCPSATLCTPDSLSDLVFFSSSIETTGRGQNIVTLGLDLGTATIPLTKSLLVIPTLLIDVYLGRDCNKVIRWDQTVTPLRLPS